MDFSIFHHFDGSGAPGSSTGPATLIFYCIYKGFSSFLSIACAVANVRFPRFWWILWFWVILMDFNGFLWFSENFVVFCDFHGSIVYVGTSRFRIYIYIYTNTLFRHLWIGRGSLFVNFRCFHRILVSFRHFGSGLGIFMHFGVF